MFFRSRSRVKASTALTLADNVCVYTIILDYV